MSTVKTRQSPLNYQKRYSVDGGRSKPTVPVPIGVHVSGGTQDGDFSDSGVHNGKRYYTLPGTLNDFQTGAYSWYLDLSDFGGSATGTGWVGFATDGSPIYYSTSQVNSPDLASNWKNGTDDSPASILVTSILV